MHRLHFKYDYQAAILENQLRAITPELMTGSTPNFNHRYIFLWGYFTVSSQELSTMALAISFLFCRTCLSTWSKNYFLNQICEKFQVSAHVLLK
jgi:hypothetical protein